MVVPVVVCLFDHPIDLMEIGRVVQRHMAVFKGFGSPYVIRLGLGSSLPANILAGCGIGSRCICARGIRFLFKCSCSIYHRGLYA